MQSLRHACIIFSSIRNESTIFLALLSQSANEIGAVVSPYEAIHDIFKYRAKYSGNEDVGLIRGTCWLRAVGGFAASIGFFLCGWRLTQGLGGKLTYVSNCRGFCSQFCAVATMILVNRLNLPESSTHSFIGSILGVGIADDPSVSSSLCAFLITYNLYLKYSSFQVTKMKG
ncbi:hypothetical protein AAC387_Pa07g2087 [Persea americana]